MKTSTKILLALSGLATGFFSWLADPANMATVNTLLKGHTRLLAIPVAALYLWNLFHQPVKDDPAPITPIKP